MKAVLLCLFAACSDVADFTPGAADGGNSIVSCAGDLDNPTGPCSYWTCSMIGTTVHCTAAQPNPGHGAGAYGCPASGGGPYCPGNDAPGSGGWSCAASAQMLTCDRAPEGTPPTTGYPGAGGSGAGQPLPFAQLTCFYPVGSRPARPLATSEMVSEMMGATPVIHVRLTIDPAFVDNSYGKNAIGWVHGHKLMDLVGMDRAEIQMTSRMGPIVIDAKVDYLSPDPMAPSGFRSLGVTGGDGMMVVGSRDDVVAALTSLDRDLNERAYSSYTVDSPATDTGYTPNPMTPDWDYRVVYELWIKASAFPGGAGIVTVPYVFATPSKPGQDTIAVEPDVCPAGWY